MPSVQAALIGYGTRLPETVQHLARVTGAIRFIGVLDPDPERTQLAIAEAAPAGRIYQSIEEVASDLEVDWVLIASPNHLHAAQSIAALKAGKHVFCEKPIATTLDDLSALQSAHRASGRHFVVGLTLRYAELYRTVRSWVSEGRIGTLVSMEFNETLDFNHGGHIHSHPWRRRAELSGSHLLEKCCQDLDLAIWMTDSLPRHVASFGGTDIFTPEHADMMTAVDASPDGRRPWVCWPTVGERVNPFTGDANVVDNQVSIIQFSNGVRATFHTNCVAGLPERRLLLLGTKGAIRADVVTGLIEFRGIGFEPETERLELDTSGSHGGGDPVLAEDLARTMLEGVAPAVSIREGVASVVTVRVGSAP
jgi:predicted dehydrogenase